MKIERTRNTKRNILWGGINKIINIVGPFIVRTVFIKELGIDYLGINSLFVSILSVLSLAELGFDSAVVFIMYEGIANDDNEVLSALLAYLKRVYRIVGITITALGILLMPGLKYLIKDFESISVDVNIYWIYLLSLMNISIGYYLGGYRNCIISAHQRQDIQSKISTIMTIVSTVLQSTCLFVFKNYYLYTVIILFVTLGTNVLVLLIAKRTYPNVVPTGELSTKEKEKLNKIVKGLFISKLGGVLCHSFDNIIISSMIGISVLAVYSNYSYIVVAIQGLILIIYQSAQGGVGNSIVVESVQKNYSDMKCFTFLSCWLISWCSICLLYLFEPFILMWIGEEGLLPDIVVVFIVIYFYMCLHGGTFDLYKTGLGIWWEDRYRTIIASSVNLVLNVICVVYFQKFGDAYSLVGIFVASILTHVFISMPWAMMITFKKYFKNGMKEYIFSLIKYFVKMCIIAIMCCPIFEKIPLLRGEKAIGYFIVRSLVCIIVPNILFVVLSWRDEEFKNSITFIKKLLFKSM